MSIGPEGMRIGEGIMIGARADAAVGGEPRGGGEVGEPGPIIATSAARRAMRSAATACASSIIFSGISCDVEGNAGRRAAADSGRGESMVMPITPPEPGYAPGGSKKMSGCFSSPPAPGRADAADRGGERPLFGASDDPRADPAVLGRLRCSGEACEAESGRRAGSGLGPVPVADIGRLGLMMENCPSTLEKLVLDGYS